MNMATVIINVFAPISPRKVVAVDETVVKANGEKYLMRVYPLRNYLTTKLFISEVLNSL